MKHLPAMPKSASELLDLPLREVIKEVDCLYVNKGGNGVGMLFLNGAQLKSLISVNISAETNTFTQVQLNVTTKMKTEDVI